MRKTNLTELLRRWVQGEANRRDEAELEQAARSDEWLAEAMEGYRRRPEADHARRLARMREKLADRPRRRMSPVWIRVAAALALLMAVGLALRLAIGGPPDAGLAQTETQADRPNADETTTFEGLAADEDGSQPAVMAEPAAPNRRRSPAQPENSAAAQPATGAAVMAEPAPEEKIDLSADFAAESKTQAEAAAAPVAIDAAGPGSERAKAAPYVSAPTMAAPSAPLAQPGGAPFSRLPNSRQITGLVLDGAGEPLVGVTVVAAGSNAGVVTDFDGRFRIQIDNSVQQLVASYVGFNAKTIPVPSDVTQLTITLEENAASMSEVVVIGRQPKHSARRSSSALTTATREATPEGGLRRFERYVRDAWPADTPNGQATLRFDLDSQGRPVNIMVASRTDEAVAAAAIRILQAGPRWQTPNGQAGSQISYTFVR
jgi:hypothetical protein